MQLTKAKISLISVSIFLAIICAILFSLQNYSKVELTENVDNMYTGAKVGEYRYDDIWV